MKEVYLDNSATTMAYRSVGELVQKVMQYQPGAVLCQGEFTLAYSVIRTLKARGIRVLAACSERNVVTHGNTKQVVFRFERFREYMDN